MLAYSFAEAEDFEEDSLELIVGNHFLKTIKSYYADKRDKNDVLFFDKNKTFPTDKDVKFIKEATLISVLDYCYPLLQKFLNEKEDPENLTSDVKIVLEILSDMAKKNIPKEFCAGMLYYLIKHYYDS